jgi:catechol 2,3-dioxygenase-like lactoylglutathione lyase family enzyme
MSNDGFLGLRTTIYRVADMDKARAWYSEVLGIRPYFDEPFYIGFNVGGFELGLQPVEDERSGAGGVETYWGVADVKAAYERLISLGATEHSPPKNVGGPIEVATVRDPWGNILGVIFNPLFASGTHEPAH